MAAVTARPGQGKGDIHKADWPPTGRFLLSQPDRARGNGTFTRPTGLPPEGFSLVSIGEFGRQNHLWMAPVAATNGKACSISDAGLNSRLCAFCADLMTSLEPGGRG